MMIQSQARRYPPSDAPGSRTEQLEVEVLRKAEELQRTPLNSVSHSPRASLAVILSALNPIAEATASPAILELARIAQCRGVPSTRPSR